MSVSAEDRRLIKKYVRLRGYGQPQYDLNIFMSVYSGASSSEKESHKDEMLKYMAAVADGTIVAGQELATVKTKLKPVGDN